MRWGTVGQSDYGYIPFGANVIRGPRATVV
jgi:hypothetical protein